MDTGEWLSLKQAGVKSLATGYASQNVTDANGNQHLQAGNYTTTGGMSRTMDAVRFATDMARNIDDGAVTVSAVNTALLELTGFNAEPSLNNARARDARACSTPHLSFVPLPCSSGRSNSKRLVEPTGIRSNLWASRKFAQ